MASISFLTSDSATPPRGTRPLIVTTENYALQACPPDIVRMAIAGFWSDQVFADFARDLVRVVLALPCRPEQHRALCDVTNASIQTRDIFSGFFGMLSDTSRPARSIAFFTSNPASRMQARRLIATRPGVALFDSEAAALDWFAAQDA